MGPMVRYFKLSAYNDLKGSSPLNSLHEEYAYGGRNITAFESQPIMLTR